MANNETKVTTLGKTDDVILLGKDDAKIQVRLIVRDKSGAAIAQVDGDFPRNLAGAKAMGMTEGEIMALAFEAWKIKTRQKAKAKGAQKANSVF